MATAPILAGDIKLLASKVMDDVPNGGGGPTGTVVPDGASNAIFGDVTERARAGGSVSIRQLFLAAQTPNTAAYMDPTIIVSKMPNDANVSITLAKTGMFAERTDMANALENYLIQGPEWGGYLLENHVAGQRSIQLFQRPGTPTPPIGRTLALVKNEGLPSEDSQFVRVTRVEVEPRVFTHSQGGTFVDYNADVVVCDLTDALRTDFPGNPPNRGFGRLLAKTVVRDTTVADAATFYGATPTTAAATVGDSVLRTASVYTQLVPSARTEVVALDQKPGAQRTIVLDTAPRRVEVGVTPHTQRIKIGQENRGFSYTAMLKPLPEPGTLVVSYMALGNWYTVLDDGAGALAGQGAGQILYATGSLAITLPSLPDVGSAVVLQWGERTGFTNRTSQGAAVRAPEYAWVIEGSMPDDAVVPGSLSITYPSAGTVRTVTDNGTGKLAGDGVGEIDYPSRSVLLRPLYMPDPGAQLQVACSLDAAVTEIISMASTSPDAGGFITFLLAQPPAAGSLQVQWATARTTSNTEGGKLVAYKSNPPPVGGGGYSPPQYPTVEKPPSQPPPPALPPEVPAPPSYGFRLDFTYSSNGTTVDLPITTYVVLVSDASFATDGAATAAMNSAFAAGPVPAGTLVGSVLTMAGTPMRVERINGLQPTTQSANFAHMKTLVYR